MKRKDLLTKAATAIFRLPNKNIPSETMNGFLSVANEFLNVFEFYGMIPPCKTQECAMGWKRHEHNCDHEWDLEDVNK